MKSKTKLAAFCIAALLGVSSMAVTASADQYGNTDFDLSPSVSETVYTKKVLKVDSSAAVVRLDHINAFEETLVGQYKCSVAFRVRNENHEYATNYVEYLNYPSSIMPLKDKKELTYFSGEGINGKYYKLFSSFDAGQVSNGTSLTGCRVSGVWAP